MAPPSSGFGPVGTVEAQDLSEAKNQLAQKSQVLSLLHGLSVAAAVSWPARSLL